MKKSSVLVATIADILGYPDVYYFSKQFKHVSATSPMLFHNNDMVSRGMKNGSGI